MAISVNLIFLFIVIIYHYIYLILIWYLICIIWFVWMYFDVYFIIYIIPSKGNQSFLGPLEKVVLEKKVF